MPDSDKHYRIFIYIRQNKRFNRRKTAMHDGFDLEFANFGLGLNRYPERLYDFN